jgi:iron complex outermembrane receptor protein
VTSEPGDLLEDISIRQGNRSFVNLGAYLQANWMLLPRLLGLNGGVRYDWHNVYGPQLSERVGLVSSPLEVLHLKLLYGTAFKAPSPTLLHAVPAAIGDVVGNPQLKPQFVRTLEFLAVWEARAYLVLSSSVAYNHLRDKTEFVQQGINRVARNVARASTVSWESRAEFKHERTLHAHVSFETQRTLRRTGQDGFQAEVVGDHAGIYPTLLLHAGLAVQPSWAPARAALQASVVGERRPSDTNIVLNGGVYTLPRYLLLDAALSSTPMSVSFLGKQELSVALLGKNLLGARGPAPGFSGIDYPLAPRSLMLQLSVRL